MKRSVLLFAILIDMAALPLYGQRLSYPYSRPPYSGPISLTYHSPVNTTARNPASYGVCDEQDVRVFASPNPQSEVHISISPTNPSILVISANTVVASASGNMVVQQGRYVSTNSGGSWNGSDALIDGSPVFGDPTTGIDRFGNIYVASMDNSNDGFSLLKSLDNGATWPTSFNTIHTSPSGTFDKEMMAIDNSPNSPYKNNIYFAWSESPSPGKVRFCRSTDLGQTFSSPISLQSSNKWGHGTNIQTGPNGEVYVAWADFPPSNGTQPLYPSTGMRFTRSLDGGLTFRPETTAISYTGISTPENTTSSTFNNTSINDWPILAVDNSNSTTRGRLYAAFHALVGGKSQIMLSYSDNKGDNWSTPTIVSISTANQSWLPWITVDNTDGTVYVVYYSFDTGVQYETNTYVAMSTNSGLTFVNQKVSDVSHITSDINNSLSVAAYSQGYIGDYIGIAAGGGRAYAAWSDNRNGTWQIYVSSIANYSNINFAPSILNPICSTSQITLLSQPSNTSAFYTTVDPAILTVSGSGLMSRVANSAGRTTVRASFPCTNYIISASVRVGQPDNPGTLSGEPNPSIGGIYQYVCSSAADGAASYQWTTPFRGNPSWSSFGGQNTGLVANFTVGSSSGNIQIAGVNSCGIGAPSYFAVSPSGGGGGIQQRMINYSGIDNETLVPTGIFYPNPTTGNLKITLPDNLGEDWRIVVLDSQGLLVMDQIVKSDKKDVTIDMRNRTNGVYFVQALTKGIQIFDKIVLQR